MNPKKDEYMRGYADGFKDGAAAVSVRPLEWKFFNVSHDHGRGVWDANRAYGTFSILDCGDKFDADGRYYAPDISGQFPTLEAAQGAVYESYSQRILAALSKAA